VNTKMLCHCSRSGWMACIANILAEACLEVLPSFLVLRAQYPAKILPGLRHAYASQGVERGTCMKPVVQVEI
jgi:hypothetical protein